MSKGTTNIPAAAVLIRKDNKILVVLRQNTGWMDGKYALPSGHVENEESFQQAAQRELLEEVGLRAKPEQFKHRLTLHEHKPDGEVRIGVTFEITDWTGEPYNAEPDVHGEITWLDPLQLPDNVTPHLRFTLEQIQAGNAYAEYGWPSQ